MADEENKSLINVKDLAGVSAPLTKLVETVGGAFGRMSDGINKVVTSYLLANKDARNEAERLELVEGAKTRAMTQRAQALAALSSGTVPHMKTIEVNSDGTVAAQLVGMPVQIQNLHNRAAQRLAYQNAMQQLNIESVVAEAAAELSSETEVAEEAVDPDWTTRFFRNVQDISNDGMHLIFGKILAGEIKKPGSFSPRTVNFLATLTQDEAESFNRLCTFAWEEDGEKSILVFGKRDNELNIGLPKEGDLTHLEDIGLIETLFTMFSGQYYWESDLLIFSYGDALVEVRSKKMEPDASEEHKPRILAGNIKLTKLGRELARVCQPILNPYVVDYVLDSWNKDGYQATLVTQVPKSTDI